jgi:predicted O-methyltransferase YrrM
MLDTIMTFAKGFSRKFYSPPIVVTWIRQDSTSRLAQQFRGNLIKPRLGKHSQQIENVAAKTNKLGPQPLWDGYGDMNIGGPTRMPDGVRTSATMGSLYSSLVRNLQPQTIVEFGSAFGVSGMYFLAGMDDYPGGQLLTFEPNEIWRNIAASNLAQISNRFVSIAGTFEENIDRALPPSKKIDFAFIDAIHTKEFVDAQLEIVIARSNEHAIIILDDISFSDSMRECWYAASRDDRFAASLALGERVGVLELR